MSKNIILKYIKICLVIVVLSWQNLNGQIEIKIIDDNGNGISHCHLFSSVNRFAYESDDSGFIRITKSFESDTFHFKHINFKPNSTYIANNTSKATIHLNFDTIQFKGFVVSRVNCDKTKSLDLNKEYGHDVEKKKGMYGGAGVVDIREKIARSFVLENSCGNLLEIKFFVSLLTETGKDIQSIYNLNFYMVDNDSAFNIPSWKMIASMDLKKVKFGWNKITIKDCSFDTKKITICMDVTLKSSDNLNVALLNSNKGKFPLYIRSENRGESNSFYFIDYSHNNLPSEWRNSKETFDIKIKTKE